MKKLIALLIAGMMVLSLTACGGGKDDPAPSSNATSDPAASQQEVQDEQPSNSTDVDTTPSSNEDPEKNSEAEGIAWPDNDFTKHIPKPESGTLLAETALGLGYSMILDMTIEEAAAYAGQLKEAGFDDDWNEKVLMFSGKNADGVRVDLTYNGEQNTLLGISFEQ